MVDSYKTISEPVRAELKEKGSRFIAQAFPANSVESAEEIIARVCKKYFDATHNCYAYVVGCDTKAVSRFNDDGEPSGTAGKPILQAISTRKLTDVVVIVTRYYGGTKLGTGGLIRAYGGVAAQALDQAHIVTQYHTEELTLRYPYTLSNVVAKAVETFQADISSSDYGTDIEQKVKIRKSLVREFCDYLVNQSSDKITIHFAKKLQD